jgi:hypothetical protein
MAAEPEASLHARLTEVRIDLDLLEDHITDTLTKIKSRLEEDPATGVQDIVQFLEQMLKELESDE